MFRQFQRGPELEQNVGELAEPVAASQITGGYAGFNGTQNSQVLRVVLSHTPALRYPILSCPG